MTHRDDGDVDFALVAVKNQPAHAASCFEPVKGDLENPPVGLDDAFELVEVVEGGLGLQAERGGSGAGALDLQGTAGRGGQ